MVGPRGGEEVFLGSIGVRFLIDGADAGQRFAFLEHPMSPRALAAPSIVTRARMSTASSSRGVWVRCWGTTW